jgi:hypothetical protein
MADEGDDHEGLIETAHLLKSPANAVRLLRSINDADRGELTEHELVAFQIGARATSQATPSR